MKLSIYYNIALGSAFGIEGLAMACGGPIEGTAGVEIPPEPCGGKASL